MFEGIVGNHNERIKRQQEMRSLLGTPGENPLAALICKLPEAIGSYPVLDACCGGRCMWADKNDPRIIGLDERSGEYQLCDGRIHRVQPDTIGDFRAMPFPDECFRLVMFDPPHLYRVGEKSWLRAKYGALNKDTWRDDLRRGLCECWRVLRKGGALIVKWNTEQIPLKDFTALFPAPPLFVTGTRKTYIFIFSK